MNTVLIVFFVIIIASFITGVFLTSWEKKHNTKVVFSQEKPFKAQTVKKVVTDNIVISNDSIEVLEMDVGSSFNDLTDVEII